jgi:hypothetical protein
MRRASPFFTKETLKDSNRMNDSPNQSVNASKSIAHLHFLTGAPLDSLLVQLAGSQVSRHSDFASPSELIEKRDNDTASNASDGTNVPYLKPQPVTTDIN